MEQNLREKIHALKISQSGLRDSQIAEALGCSKSVVQYHLNPDTRKVYRYRSNKNKKINMGLIKMAHGGKCKICGYDACMEALDFHHLDASTKIGNVTLMLAHKGKLAAQMEANKCVLLCRNCHAEVHHCGLEIPAPLALLTNLK